MKMVVLITTTTGHFKIDNLDPLLVLFYWIEIEMIIYLITFWTAGADGSNKWAPTFDLTDLELATEDTWSATGRDSGTGCSVGVLIVCAECWVCWANADIAHNTPETVALEKIRHLASESACCVFMQVSET